jgi:hypothetical protein
MTTLSLDSEPPSKFEGKKEVSRKKNRDIPQLVFLLKNEKIKSKANSSVKNLEKKVILEKQKSNINLDYIKNDEYAFEENLTKTNESLEFTSMSRTPIQDIPEFSYGQSIRNIEFKEKNTPIFYDMTSSYSFIPQKKEESKKEELSELPREQEIKEIQYTLYNFEEETKQEN